MAGPIPVHPSETFEYVLQQNQDDPPEDQVRFRCRTLTGRERNEISEGLAALVAEDISTTERVAAVGKAARLCCLSGVQGWENWFDPAGSPVPFPGRREAILEALHPADIQELGMEIGYRSGLWAHPRVEGAVSD